jgi:hypothetical protein
MVKSSNTSPGAADMGRFCINKPYAVEARLSNDGGPVMGLDLPRRFLGGVVMLLSYQDFFDEEAGRTEVEAELTTEHSASSYGQPVIVLEDGGSLDLVSWVSMDYRVEEADNEERAALQKMGLI